MYLRIRVSSCVPSDIKMEIKALGKGFFFREIPEITLRKGLRYILTIIELACLLLPLPSSPYRFSKLFGGKLPDHLSQEIDRTFDWLRQKVKLWIKRCDEEAKCVRLPCEVLGLGEVQNEIN